MKRARVLLLFVLVAAASPDLVVPGWKKVRADNVISHVAPAPNTYVWFAEIGFGFATADIVRLTDFTSPLPFHHYGALRLIGVPTADVASTGPIFDRLRARTSKPEDPLPEGWVATSRLGGGFVSIPEADATATILRRLRIDGIDGARVSTTLETEVKLDTQGRPIDARKGMFYGAWVALAAVVGLAGLAWMKRRRETTP